MYEVIDEDTHMCVCVCALDVCLRKWAVYEVINKDTHMCVCVCALDVCLRKWAVYEVIDQDTHVHTLTPFPRASVCLHIHVRT